MFSTLYYFGSAAEFLRNFAFIVTLNVGIIPHFSKYYNRKNVHSHKSANFESLALLHSINESKALRMVEPTVSGVSLGVTKKVLAFISL